MGWLSKAICRTFGHTRRAGWWGDGLYGSVDYRCTDNIGRTHYEVALECDRCGKKYVGGRFHGSAVKGPTS